MFFAFKVLVLWDNFVYFYYFNTFSLLLKSSVLPDLFLFFYCFTSNILTTKFQMLAITYHGKIFTVFNALLLVNRDKGPWLLNCTWDLAEIRNLPRIVVFVSKNPVIPLVLIYQLDICVCQREALVSHLDLFYICLQLSLLVLVQLECFQNV